MRKLILAGGTGFLGSTLSTYFQSQFDEIVILSRNQAKMKGKVRRITWDGKTMGSWTEELEGADVIVNLTGKNINCRYTEANKQEIISSRIDSTNIIGEAIKKCKTPPGLWINFSAIAIYKNSLDTAYDEFSTEQGKGFMYDVCKLWEEAFNTFKFSTTRKITLRVSVVMGKKGGMVPELLPLVKMGLGGKAGNGKQTVSWIHEMDLCRMIEYFIKNKNTQGIYNASSPNPVTNSELMSSFRKACRIPFGFPTPEPFVKLGAWLMGTEPSLILDSTKIIPRKSLSEGFTFQYPTIDLCLNSLV